MKSNLYKYASFLILTLMSSYCVCITTDYFDDRDLTQTIIQTNIGQDISDFYYNETSATSAISITSSQKFIGSKNHNCKNYKTQTIATRLQPEHSSPTNSPARNSSRYDYIVTETYKDGVNYNLRHLFFTLLITINFSDDEKDVLNFVYGGWCDHKRLFG